jgi:UDP-2,4-diacetamido-2,4,6-trideoxy-beta-L-altropyranose hydrolase
MKIVFRVDASLKMGIGHFMRCLTLANELNRQKHEIFFICRNLVGNLISKIQYPVMILPANKNFQSDDLYLNWLESSQEEDANQTIEVIPKNTDLLIVDNYALNKDWHIKLRAFSKKIMVIDDLADRIFDCDILLNQNLDAHASDYQSIIPDECELYLGCNFALLRPEFQKLRKKAIIKRKNTLEIKNILVNMGGIDEKNIVYDVLKNIPDNFNIVVILGGQSQHNTMIKNYAQFKKNIKVEVDAKNMSELMFNADLAIGAGGSTSWERCCLGLPTLLYVLSENQNQASKNLEKRGAVKIVRNLKVNLHDIVDNLNLWQSMSDNAIRLCDGEGVKRIKI